MTTFGIGWGDELKVRGHSSQDPERTTTKIISSTNDKTNVPLIVTVCMYLDKS